MDERVRNPREYLAERHAALTPDLMGLALTLHGTVCAGAVVGFWKLHGESKFGLQPQNEMRELRARLLRKVSTSLKETFNPILTLQSSVIITPDDTSQPQSARLSDIGEEKLLNAVTAFIKSDEYCFQSLRQLDSAHRSITKSLKNLRKIAVLTAIVSGIFVALALADKFLFQIDSGWPHWSGISAVSFLLGWGAWYAIGIMRAVNRLDSLKEKHADLQ